MTVGVYVDDLVVGGVFACTDWDKHKGKRGCSGGRRKQGSGPPIQSLKLVSLRGCHFLVYQRKGKRESVKEVKLLVPLVNDLLFVDFKG
jgi:hypothetical protein